MTTTETKIDELLTPAEVAKALRVHKITVHRWIEDGVLDAVELPGAGLRRRHRIKESELARIIRQREAR